MFKFSSVSFRLRPLRAVAVGFIPACMHMKKIFFRATVPCTDPLRSASTVHYTSVTRDLLPFVLQRLMQSPVKWRKEVMSSSKTQRPTEAVHQCPNCQIGYMMPSDLAARLVSVPSTPEWHLLPRLHGPSALTCPWRTMSECLHSAAAMWWWRWQLGWLC